ncbi:TIGR04222 domain-containing membrane protein [Klebsiella aerogenes]|nr:TIGR04222 domain-containing membrane protein [Klebsiella aerogenes]
MWTLIMHMHPLLFLGCIIVVVPAIYLSIGIIIALTRPAAKAQQLTTGIDPWLLAWIDGGGTRVIQLAMFSLLHKGYLWSPEPGQMLANGRYASNEMNIIERILFDHFEVRKPCHEDLPTSLQITSVNIWQDQQKSPELTLSMLRRRCNFLLFSIPSLILAVILACRIFIYPDVAENAFCWILMVTGSLLWFTVWGSNTWDHNRLDLNGVSHNNSHALIGLLREKLAQTGDEMDEATAMLVVAVNGIESLPESFRDYKELIGPVSYISSICHES